MQGVPDVGVFIGDTGEIVLFAEVSMFLVHIDSAVVFGDMLVNIIIMINLLNRFSLLNNIQKPVY